MITSVFGQKMLSYCPRYYSDSRVFQAQLDAKGHELDSLSIILEDIEAQFFVSTATWGLRYWEEMCGISVNEHEDIDIRRAKVLVKLQKFPTSRYLDIERIINLYVSTKTAKVQVVNEEYFFQSTIPVDELLSFSNLLQAVEETKPAHLEHIPGLLSTIDSANSLQATDTHKVNVNPYNQQLFKLDGEWALNGQMNLDNQPGNKDNNTTQQIKVSSHHIFLLNGGWTLNGRECLDSEPVRESFSSMLTVEKDLWYLDGTHFLDGTKPLDAEIIEYQL
jgi:hypothetical protein